MGLRKVWARRKVLDDEHIKSTDEKAISSIDLIGYSLNSTHALGFHILIGLLIANYAGPSACISIFLAMVAALLAGLCYAEFSARIPQSGNAYMYSYVSLGELIAFIVGWALIFEIILAAACLSRAFTSYIDFIFDGEIIAAFQEIIVIDINYLSTYIDFASFGIPIIVTIILLFPIPAFPSVNKFIAAINVILALTIIVIGITKANPKNWSEMGPISIFESAQKDNIFNTKTAFFPLGFSGVLKGVPVAFCAFMLIEYISMTPKGVVHKTTVNPIILSLFITCIELCAISIIVTLMIPYNQITDVKELATILPFAFLEVGMDWASWIAVGSGLLALTYSIFIIMGPLPKLLYEMSKDCLIFHILGRSSDEYRTPIFGFIFFAVLSGIAGAFCSLNLLLNLVSLSILLIYTFITAAVLIIRYSDGRIERHNYLSSEINPGSCSNLVVTNDIVTFGDLCQQFFNNHQLHSPNAATSLSVKINVILFCIFSIILNYCVIHRNRLIFEGAIWMICLVGVVAILTLCVLISIALQPKDARNLSYHVPLLPFLPAVSIFINIHISLWIDWQVWSIFAVWIIAGLCMYFICLKIYKRCESTSTNCLNRQEIHDRMNYAYDNRVSINEEVIPIPEDALTPIGLRKSMLENQYEKPSNGIHNPNFVDSPDYSDEEPEVYEEPEVSEEVHDPRISNATHVLEMFDQMISDSEKQCFEEMDDTEEPMNRKTSIDTDSNYSTIPPYEHIVLVHSEDAIIEEEQIVEIKEPVEVPLEEEPQEQNDVITDFNANVKFVSKTPNVSRAESMRCEEKPPPVSDFAFKLNQLLQDQLADKPRLHVGFLKPEHYDDSDVEETPEPRSSEKSEFLELIHKELLERQKLKEQNVPITPMHRDSTASDISVVATPQDIRNKLEEIFKAGPINPEERQKTLRKAVTLPPPPMPDFSRETSQVESNPNETSGLAQLLREKSLVLNKQPQPDANIPVPPDPPTVSTELLDEEKVATLDNANTATIKLRLNKIFSEKKIHPLVYQPFIAKLKIEPPNPPPEPKEIETEQISSVAQMVSSINAKSAPIPVPPPQPDHLIGHDNTAHKKLMSNVFDTIKLRRKHSDRSEGSFLANLKTQNGKAKNNEFINREVC